MVRSAADIPSGSSPPTCRFARLPLRRNLPICLFPSPNLLSASWSRLEPGVPPLYSRRGGKCPTWSWAGRGQLVVVLVFVAIIFHEAADVRDGASFHQVD